MIDDGTEQPLKMVGRSIYRVWRGLWTGVGMIVVIDWRIDMVGSGDRGGDWGADVEKRRTLRIKGEFKWGAF